MDQKQVRLKKRQTYEFTVAGPSRIAFSRVGGGIYMVTVGEIKPEVTAPSGLVTPQLEPKAERPVTTTKGKGGK